MKEKIFTQMGFKKETVSKEEAGGESGYYYYSIDIGDITLLTCANDEVVKGEWICKILDFDSIVFKTEEQLTKFIDILKSSFVNNEKK